MRSHRRVTLFVFGAPTYLGREVARFGRAMGHRIIAVADGSIPERDEPWMHGVHWVTGPEPNWKEWQDWPEGPPLAFIYCDTALWNGGPLSSAGGRFEEVLLRRPCRLMEVAQSMEHSPRFLLRSTLDQPLLPRAFTTFSRRAEDRLKNSALDSVIFRMPILYGPDRPDSVAAMMIASGLARLPFASPQTQVLSSLRVETAALAMLRAALEPEIEGILLPPDIARIGDVMIAQGSR